MFAKRRMVASRRGDLLLVVVAVAVAVPAALLRVSGDGVLVGGEPLGALCWLRELIGIGCPFCGMTRSMIALVHGDIVASLAFHPGGILIATLLVAGVGGALAAAVLGRAPVSVRPAFRRLVEGVALTCMALGAGRAVALALG